jgi:hypothetical protein
MFSAIFRSTILQLGVPDALRGRLSALHLMVVTGGPRVGDLEATGVAAAVGASLSVISGGVLCILGLIAVASSFPELVRYDAQVAAAEAETETELDTGAEAGADGADASDAEAARVPA